MRSGRLLGVLLVLLTCSCLGDVDVAPSAPTLFPVESPTRRSTQTLEGTKPANTAVLNHGLTIVALDELETWSHQIQLEPGENLIDLVSQKANGKLSEDHATATIVYEPDFPAQPVMQPVQSPTNQTSVQLSGTKQAQTSLTLDELDAQGTVLSSDEIVALDAEEEWSYTLDLGSQEQVHHYSLVAKDTTGRGSEPLDFEIELDLTPPSLASHYPLVDEADLPTNTLIYLVLDGPLGLTSDSLDPGILRIEDSLGNPVASSIMYNPLSYSLFLAAMLSADTSYSVVPDPALIVDRAGNPGPAGADWSWSFATGNTTDTTSPPAPTVDHPAGVDPGTGRTELTRVELIGTKQALTSVWIGRNEVTALNDATSWSYTYDLAVGDNLLDITAKSRTGRPSTAVSLTIVRDLVRPDAPTLDPMPADTVSEAQLVLEGTKPAGTSVLYNGQVVVPRSAETEWIYNADLVPGPNEIELRTKDAEGTLSEPLHFLVDFAQTYDGPVEAGFKLLISFSLRDLSNVSPVQSTFDTGVNHYSIDAWIEGPLEPGESCGFDSQKKERKDIQYLATLVHYIGSKAGHENPFWDADYRAPDYLAALVSGGVFDYLGLGPTSDRRNDATGFHGGDLVDGTGKIRLTTEDLRNIDGVTEATVSSGPYTIEWVPLDRNLQRIQQGEYLIHILLGLDRDPGWVANNDLETCWGDESFTGVGQHRIVRRMSLGAVPYSVTVGQTGELSAPDAEQGAEQLRYLTGQGITFRWVKN